MNTIEPISTTIECISDTIAIYIKLSTQKIHRTINKGEINYDLDENNILVGIEILPNESFKQKIEQSANIR